MQIKSHTDLFMAAQLTVCCLTEASDVAVLCSPCAYVSPCVGHQGGKCPHSLCTPLGHDSHNNPTVKQIS